MKKRILISLLLALVMLVSVSGAALAGDGTLVLENKDPVTWVEIEDGYSATLLYTTAGVYFNYSLLGNVAEDVEYSLIYYADPWAGNNPGALIGTGAATGGNIEMNGTIDLGMSLPDPQDANYPDGAKIWLLPSDCYDPALSAVSLWQPTRFFFERELITYEKLDPVPDPAPPMPAPWGGGGSFTVYINNAMTCWQSAPWVSIPSRELAASINLTCDGINVAIPAGTIVNAGAGWLAAVLGINYLNGNLSFLTPNITFSNPVVISSGYEVIATFTAIVNGIPQ